MAESQSIEYKKSWRDEYLKWICGFANAQGGSIFIGKDDDGNVVGIKNAKKLLEDIPNKVRDILGIIIEVNSHIQGGKTFLEIIVEPYLYPISYKGRYHFRSGSTKQELKGAALDRFLLQKQGHTWDSIPMPKVSLRDLSKPAIRQFRELATQSGRLNSADLRETDAGLIEKLNLTEGNYLKRAALVLFHKEPERFFSGAFVKIGYFRSQSDLVYHDEVHGDLFTQVAGTMDLLMTKYFKAAISYEGIQRIERFPVPSAALREAVLNALVHRDYAIHAPVQIRVYDDCLKIWNPAVLPEGWTLKSLLGEHSSRPFNPYVANTFFRAGEIEAWGRGIQHMFAACRSADAPEPQIRYNPNDLWLEFPFSPAYRAVIGSNGSVKNAGERLDERLDEKLDEKLGKRRATIIRLMIKNPNITVTEVGKNLGISRTAADKNIQIFKKNGWVRRIGPAKGGQWEVIKQD